MIPIIVALNKVYQKKAYLGITATVFIVALGLNYYSLIMAVPGSSLGLFFTTSAWWQPALPFLLSFLISILIGMQVYMLRQRFDKATTAKAGIGAFSSVSGILGSIISSAGCVSCLIALLSFLGIGTILVLLTYRYYIITGSIILLLLSVHLTAKSILCTACSVTERE